MNRVRRPPLQHPLALLFDRAVDSLCVALSDETIRHYRGTVRNFLSYLGADHPGVQRLDQLRREPHILGWMSRLHSQVPPLGDRKSTRLNSSHGYISYAVFCLKKKITTDLSLALLSRTGACTLFGLYQLSTC